MQPRQRLNYVSTLSTKMLAAAVVINWTITLCYWQWLSGLQARSSQNKLGLQAPRLSNAASLDNVVKQNNTELRAEISSLAPESRSKFGLPGPHLSNATTQNKFTFQRSSDSGKSASFHSLASESEEPAAAIPTTHEAPIAEVGDEPTVRDWTLWSSIYSQDNRSRANLGRGNSNLRWFVYDMPERFVTPTPANHQAEYSIYSAEEHFFRIIRTRRVNRAEDANIFYVPVFVSAFLAGENASLEEQARPSVRKAAGKLVLDAISWARKTFPFWNRSSGSDHVFLFSHENGPCLDFVAERAQKSRLTPVLLKTLQNSLILSHTGDLRSGCYESSHTVVLPPWVPDVVEDVAAIPGWRKDELLDLGRKRRNFLYFQDKTTLHDSKDAWQGIRLLYGKEGTEENEGQVPDLEACIDSRKITSATHCERATDKCKEAEVFRSRVLSRGVRQILAIYFAEFEKACPNCSKSHPIIYSAESKSLVRRSSEMFDSIFCLCTRGLADWNVRIFEALMAGCIPVIISDEADLPYQGLVDWSKISIRVREAFAQNVYDKLVRLTDDEILQFRRNIRAVLSDLIYPSRRQTGKAVDRAEDLLWNLMQRRANHSFHDVPLLNSSQNKPYPQAISASEQDIPVKDDICLALQMTPDRLSMLAKVAKLWEGSIVAIILIRADMNMDYVNDVRQDFYRTVMAAVQSKKPAGGEGAASSDSGSLRLEFYRSPSEWKYYPVNALRNIALQGCAQVSQFAITVDVDFVPSKHAFRLLQGHAAKFLSADSPRRALVVPAFETSDLRLTVEGQLERLLANKNEIVEGYRFDDKFRQRQTKRTESLIWPFDQKRSTTGHRATNSEYWMKATAPYNVDYRWGWEPYLLVRAPFPVYDETFVAYGQNKVMYAYELMAAGFEFVVVPDVYLLHAHVDPDKHVSAPNPKQHQVGWSCWADFVVRIQDTYGVRIPTPCWAAKYVYPKVTTMYQDRCISNSKDLKMINLHRDLNVIK